MIDTRALRALAARVDAGDEPLLTLQEVATVTGETLRRVRYWVYTDQSLPTIPVGPNCRPRVRASVIVALWCVRDGAGHHSV
jgi:hypothetical protein